MDAGPTIVLIGPMGVGKTTVGTLLAANLDRSLLDSDALIESSTGSTTAEIAGRDGVPELHRLEAHVLDRALSSTEPSVIASASSVVDRPGVVERLAAGAELVVYLWAPPDVAAARAAGGAHRRPLDEGETDLLFNRRDERYRRSADLVLDTTSLGPDEIVARVVAAMGR